MPSPYESDRFRCSKPFQIYIILTIVWVSVNAEFYQDRFKSLARHESWTPVDHDADVTQDFASSEYSPSYASFPHSSKHASFESTESFDRPKEWLSAFASKRIPHEDKRFKKIISPFYTITEKDSQKYKDIVMKSGIPYCQEIKTRRPSKDGDSKSSTICYKCKNPKNGATYEQCSYVSQPSSSSSDQEPVVDSPSGYRNRRSNEDESLPHYSGSRGYGRHDSPYRFNERFFSDASEDVPAEYRNKDEKCDKVVKDSMVCMVCRNTKNNAKYEQCSYVRQPTEKSYAYRKSSSFKDPERSKEAEDHEDQDDRSETKPVHEHSEYNYGKVPDERAKLELEETSKNCREVKRDSKTCTVCKDPDTGGNYEKCSYSYQPDDKVYKFSSSKSFGHPTKSSSYEDPQGHKGDESSEKLTSEADDEYKRDYSIPESSYFKQDEPEHGYHRAASENTKSTSDHEDPLSGYARSRTESEKIAGSISPINCEQVQRGSLSCKVCKDPKTGSNSEQCSYQHQPTEKSYSYSKSRSFEKPGQSEDKSYDGTEDKETRQPYKDRSFGFFDDDGPTAKDSSIKRESSIVDQSTDEESKESTLSSAPKKVDADFYDAFKKKAEIQKFLREFQKEDRSNCKKLMRGRMTCYQCVDEKGFRKEECAYITDGESAEDNVEEVEVEPSRKVPRSIHVEWKVDTPAEPDASASENIETTASNKNPEDAEKIEEAEPYEFVAETRPVYDRVLGITLPAYMLTTSEHEQEFDRILGSGSV